MRRTRADPGEPLQRRRPRHGHEFYDTSTDPLETAKQIWSASRSRRLVDRFVALHTPVKSWAHPDVALPVVPFCMYPVLIP